MPTPDEFLEALRNYKDVPHLYGGKTAAGLDCSGLISLALKDLGVAFPAGSSAQIAACTPIAVVEAKDIPGSLLYREGHDGISTGKPGVIEARSPVVVEGIWSDTYDGGKTRWTKAGLIPGINYSKEDTVSAPTISSPVAGRVSSAYGYRTLNGKRSLHAGADVAAALGSTVRAIYAGTVERVVSGRKPGQPASSGTVLAPGRSGNGVIVRNPDGERQLYGHVNPSVKVGDKVAIGSPIGVIDRSGITTGPHVHLEVWGNASPNSHRDPAGDFRFHKVTLGSAPVIPSEPTPTPTPTPTPSTPAATGDPVVKAWQERQNKYGKAGLYPDGIKGRKSLTWEVWVKQLQNALNEWKAVQRLGRLVPDGDYGSKTDEAVYAVQKANPATFGTPDRVVGPKTVKALGIPAKPNVS